MDVKDFTFIESIVGAERFIKGDCVNEDYSHDEMTEYGRFMPEAVALALTAEEVSQILSYTYGNNIPVTPRGSGTGLCGGAVAIHGGLVLSLAKMDRVLEIDPDNMTATVEPGVLLMEFNKRLLESGLMYPPDPGEKSATLGGNVMTNAGGMRAVKYGVTRDYVRGLEVVLPDGRITEFGGKVAKNSSGYSLKDIMVGSEGTLGIVTKLILRLIPAPKKTVSLLSPFESIDMCIDAVPAVIREGFSPTALEFMQQGVIELAETYLGKKFPDKSSAAYLLLSFDGESAAELSKVCDAAAKLLVEKGAKDVFYSDTEERQESIWSARGAFLEAIKSATPSMDECDVVVARNKIPEFLRYINELEKENDVRIFSFGHAGDGNIHIYICRDGLSDGVWEPLVSGLMRRMYARSRELSGQVSGEHGIGHAKIKYLEASLDQAAVSLMEGIKRVFDPKGLLNPGKVVGR